MTRPDGRSDADYVRDSIARLRPRAKFVAYSHSSEFIDGSAELAEGFHYVSLYDETIDSNVVSSRRGLIMIQNTYLSSFAYNLFLCWLYSAGRPDREHPASELKPLLAHNFKKFFAEQLLHARNNLFSRAIFLETLLYEQARMVPVFDEKDRNADLDRRAVFGANLMSSAVSFHEFGHYLLRRAPEHWDAVLKEHAGILGVLFHRVGAAYSPGFVEEFQCDAIAVVSCLEQYGQEEGRDFCVRTIVFAYAAFAVLSSLTKSARKTAAEQKEVKDEVDFRSIRKRHRDYEYVTGTDADFAERARLVIELCANVAAAEGLSLFGEHGPFPLPASILDELLLYLEGILDSDDRNARDMSMLVAEALHEHPRGTELPVPPLQGLHVQPGRPPGGMKTSDDQEVAAGKTGRRNRPPVRPGGRRVRRGSRSDRGKDDGLVRAQGERQDLRDGREGQAGREAAEGAGRRDGGRGRRRPLRDRPGQADEGVDRRDGRRGLGRPREGSVRVRQGGRGLTPASRHTFRRCGMRSAMRMASAGLVLASFACGRGAEPQQTRRTEPAAAPAANLVPAAEAAAPERTVAFTFDDLPMSRDGAYGLARMQDVTTRLLGQLTSAGIVAVGFVNEDKLDRGGDRPARVALLEQWLDAGMELGNHTYAHVSFWTTPLDEYQRQVLRGERVTRALLAERGKEPRYFRHPYLNSGPDLRTKDAFERFLAEHGYRVAPVTVDNLDVTYALAYDKAHQQGDSALMRRIGGAYVEHMGDSFAFSEALSRRVLDREPAQVLMLHANALNADYLDELVAMLQARGYGFVPTEQALRDPAYRSRDTYTGRRGLSWLQRWAITRGEEPGREPREAEWVRKAAYP